MRFGIRLGPFSVSTSTRRRRSPQSYRQYKQGRQRREAYATLYAAEKREREERAEAARAEAAAEAEAAVKAEASRAAWRDIARQMGSSCRSCGAEHRTSLEYVSGDPAYTGLEYSKLVVRCRSCGTETSL